MKFEDNQPIYLQISHWINDKILRGEWLEDQRIPSVRELGTLLQVNPNTVMRAYELLQVRQVIYNQRGIGYFVGRGAGRIIREEQREEFLKNELPRLFDRMALLDVGLEQLTTLFHHDQKNRTHENKQ